MTDVEMTDLSGDAGAEPTVYEVGYHILPTVGEKELPDEINKVTDALKALEADFVGEKLPMKIQLAYPIEKKVDGAKRWFESAYFGWVAFEIAPGKIGEVKDAMDKNPQILRYIIVKTGRDEVAAAMADPSLDISTAVKREAESGGVLSEEALDTALKQIASEDTKVEEKA